MWCCGGESCGGRERAREGGVRRVGSGLSGLPGLFGLPACFGLAGGRASKGQLQAPRAERAPSDSLPGSRCGTLSPVATAHRRDNVDGLAQPPDAPSADPYSFHTRAVPSDARRLPGPEPVFFHPRSSGSSQARCDPRPPLIVQTRSRPAIVPASASARASSCSGSVTFRGLTARPGRRHHRTVPLALPAGAPRPATVTAQQASVARHRARPQP